MPYDYRKSVHYMHFPLVIVKALKHAGASPSQTCYALSSVIQFYQLGMNLLNKRSERPIMAFTPAEFVQIRLTEKQKIDYVKWAAEHEVDVGLLLSELAASGHKVTLSHSDKSGAFICSVTCRDKDSGNHMNCVSSYHEDALNAILVALYKHFVVLADTLWGEAQSQDNWG
jgi:hypothetical protein